MTDPDWDLRALCPDGACVGVIGKDGTCKVCGRVAPGWGSERERGLRTEEEVEPELIAHKILSEPEGPADFDDRKLCPDGACVGLINADGRCSVCGRADE